MVVRESKQSLAAFALVVALAAPVRAEDPPAGADPHAAQRARLSEILGGGAAPAAPPAAVPGDQPTAAPRDQPAAAAPSEGAPRAAGLPADWVPRPWDGGSISMGSTNEGYLLHGVPFPLRGDGFRLLAVVPERGTTWGTAELVAAVRRAARLVAERHPGPPLVVGNLSLETGGPIAFSESHESGRDADLLFFARDAASGEPVEPSEFVLYGCDGTSEDGRLRFDVPRNWALVEAILSDESVQVQFIFVSGCLKRQLLAHAKAAGAPAALVQRAKQILWKPSDALSHRDHFHVRLYCSVDDVAAGCVDGGRFWDWVPTRPERRLEAAERVQRGLRHRDAKQRRAAIRELVAGWYGEIAFRLPRLLDDPDRGVREAAAAALAQLDAETSYGGVTALLKPPTDLARFRRGLETLVRLGSYGSAWRLEQILAGCYAPLEELKPDAATRARLRALAARGLGRIGRYRSVPALLAALEDRHAPTRDAAHEALRRLTNQRAAAAAAEPAAVAAAWHAWWKAHSGEKEAQWHRDGFRAAGHQVPFETWTWAAVPALVAAAAAPDETGWTAHRLLARIAKRTAPPTHPDPAVRGARWRAWWWGVHPRLARKWAGPSS